MDADQTARLRADIEALRAESLEREAELREIAALLPAATSRRAVLTSMARDLRRVPDRGAVAKRVVAKVLRTPGDLLRRLRST